MSDLDLYQVFFLCQQILEWPEHIFVKETYGWDAEFTEDGWDKRIGATEYAEGNGTRKRGREAEHITQG